MLSVDEYCTEPLSIRAGFFMCKPSQCDSFRAGTQLHYVCNKNYEMRPGDQAVLTCLPGGVWSREPPVCLPGLPTNLDNYVFCSSLTPHKPLPSSIIWYWSKVGDVHGWEGDHGLGLWLISPVFYLSSIWGHLHCLYSLPRVWDHLYLTCEPLTLKTTNILSCTLYVDALIAISLLATACYC